MVSIRHAGVERVYVNTCQYSYEGIKNKKVVQAR